eukprot:TRINITY_DN5069_c0_g1_i1.p1 TRINITY_DN5069_c0_g1~~TRINITY_DN5069_c0_g1_i1.p1  ORF type:complete len:614 (-),score=64.14 TRINITY_DN5069_c0_g1_i1:112-1953(-)
MQKQNMSLATAGPQVSNYKNKQSKGVVSSKRQSQGEEEKKNEGQNQKFPIGATNNNYYVTSSSTKQLQQQPQLQQQSLQQQIPPQQNSLTAAIKNQVMQSVISQNQPRKASSSSRNNNSKNKSQEDSSLEQTPLSKYRMGLGTTAALDTLQFQNVNRNSQNTAHSPSYFSIRSPVPKNFELSPSADCGEESAKMSYEQQMKERLMILQKNKVDQMQIQKQAKLECAQYILQQSLRSKVPHKDLNSNKKYILNLLKVINAIYYEFYKLATKYNNSEQLIFLAYELYNQKFGMKKLAESKLFYFFQELRKYELHPKIMQFCRYCGLVQYSFNQKEIVMYLNALKHLYGNFFSSKAMVLTEPFETDQELMEQTTEALFKEQFDSRELLRINQEVKQLKDFESDVVVQYYLNIYRNKANEKLKDFQFIFDCLSNQNQKMTYQGFQILLKYIEPLKNDIYENYNLFYKFCNDMTDGNAQNIFQFAEMCSSRNLFSANAQDRFNKQVIFQNVFQEESKIQNFAHLKTKWLELQKKYKLRFIESKQYSALHQYMIKKLDYLLGTQTASQIQDQTHYQLQCTFIFKIVALESITCIIDSFTDQFIPEKLFQIANIYNPTQL